MQYTTMPAMEALAQAPPDYGLCSQKPWDHGDNKSKLHPLLQFLIWHVNMNIKQRVSYLAKHHGLEKALDELATRLDKLDYGVFKSSNAVMIWKPASVMPDEPEGETDENNTTNGG